jgi:hypothetical protein
MKAVLEFGIRGGRHVDNIVLPSAKLAARIAHNVARVLMDDEISTDFRVSRRSPRISLTSSAHFVSVSLLDGSDRGPAAATLWRKPK